MNVTFHIPIPSVTKPPVRAPPVALYCKFEFGDNGLARPLGPLKGATEETKTLRTPTLSADGAATNTTVFEFAPTSCVKIVVQVTVGAWLSVIVTEDAHEPTLPASSLCENVDVKVRDPSKLRVSCTPGAQPAVLTIVSINEAAFVFAGGVDAATSFRTRMYAALSVFVLRDKVVAQEITGATVSRRMSDVHVLVLPEVSLAVYTTGYLPSVVINVGFGLADTSQPGVLSTQDTAVARP